MQIINHFDFHFLLLISFNSKSDLIKAKKALHATFCPSFYHQPCPIPREEERASSLSYYFWGAASQFSLRLMAICLRYKASASWALQCWDLFMALSLQAVWPAARNPPDLFRSWHIFDLWYPVTGQQMPYIVEKHRPLYSGLIFHCLLILI